jgi:hypothetical protein
MESALQVDDVPIGPADPAWDEAYLRVQSYLRAYGLESPVLLSQATSSIIEEARSKATSTQAEPVELAMEVTHFRIGAWFAQAGCPIDPGDLQIRMQVRLALIIVDVPRRWANHFLSPDPIPANLAAAMTSFRILPGPEMRTSGMAPEPLEFGILEPGDSRLPNRRLWVPVRVVASWLLIFGLFGFAWAATH